MKVQLIELDVAIGDYEHRGDFCFTTMPAQTIEDDINAAILLATGQMSPDIWRIKDLEIVEIRGTTYLLVKFEAI